MRGNIRTSHFKLFFWKNNIEIYPGAEQEAAVQGKENDRDISKEQETVSDGQESGPISEGENEIVTQIFGKRWNKSFCATGKLSGLHDNYQLCVTYPLTELNKIWKRLFQIYMAISVGVMIVLAVLMNILLRKFLQPLECLAKQADEIGKGNYQSRVEIRGNDEVAKLGQSLNVMAETIEQNFAKLERDNENKEALIENLAHEMKSPLTSIYGYAEYLLKANPTQENAIKYYQIIMSESKRMQEMAYALMDLAELRNQTVAMEYFSVSDFWEQQQSIIARQFAKDEFEERQKADAKQPVKGVKAELPQIIWENQLSDTKEFYGNSQLLSMLVLNLISNAVRAVLGKTTGEVKVILKKHSPKGICLMVKDNGIGIPREQMERITEPFYRIDKGRSRAQGGNGLGLALCSQIVELHQGSMEIESEEGSGTIIRVLL